MSGTKKNIEVVKRSTCNSCNGVGYNLSEEDCSHCDGKGSIHFQQSVMRVMSQCGFCKATGKKVLAVCDVCQGNQVVSNSEKIEVNIPQGIEHGSMIQVKDNYMATIAHAEHPIFKRSDNPLHLSQFTDIEWLDALLGKSLNIPTLSGIKKIKLKPVVQQSSTLRIKGSGLVDENGNKGHMFVKLNINMPKDLSEKQIKLLKEIRRENGGKS
jgi:molecular chaperone DnaJ